MAFDDAINKHVEGNSLDTARAGRKWIITLFQSLYTAAQVRGDRGDTPKTTVTGLMTVSVS